MEYAFAGHGVMVSGLDKNSSTNMTEMYSGHTYDMSSKYNSNTKNTFWFVFIPDDQT